MATPASVPQSALTKAMGMVGRAAAGAAVGLGRRKASRLAMKNLRPATRNPSRPQRRALVPSTKFGPIKARSNT